MTRLDLRRRALAPAIAMLAGCAGVPPPAPGTLAIEAMPAALTRPAIHDWASQLVSSPALLAARRARFRALAFPNPAIGWSTGDTPGLPLTTYGCDPSDFVPNGLAAAFTESAGSPLRDKLFYLTKQGKLLKVDRNAPNQFARWDAPAGTTFSRTFVTLSPQGGRAYLLADDGTLFVVETRTMTTIGMRALGEGGYGIAPWIDPFASRTDDGQDRVYVATNAGAVHDFEVRARADGTIGELVPRAVHAVARDVVPLFGARHKLAASPVVLRGVIHIGDQAGNFHAYNTIDPNLSRVYRVEAPVAGAAAIEIQDGSYRLTDPSGKPKAVPALTPVFAFVPAGITCAWINLHDGTVTRSRPLRVDDADPGRRFGFLADYAYGLSGTTERLAAVDGGSLDTTGAAAGELLGPVTGFLRWQSGRRWEAGSIVAAARLSLRAFDAGAGAVVPEVRPTSPFFAGTQRPWLSDALNGVNRPSVGAARAGTLLSEPLALNGGARLVWDVTSNFAVPAPDGRYALALVWPPGAAGPRFRNNPLARDPGPAGPDDPRPQLTLTIARVSQPTATIATPPLIDALEKRVYLFYTNALYQLSFASPGAFADTVPGEKHTRFNMVAPRATFDGGRKHIANFTAPVPLPDFSATYVLGRVPSDDGAAPERWDYTLAKLLLPLDENADRVVAGSPTFAGIAGQAALTGTPADREAGASMSIDPAMDSKDVYFSLAGGRIYRYER